MRHPVSTSHTGSAPGRLRPEAAVLRQARNRPQDGFTSGLSPKGEYRRAQPEGSLVKPPGRHRLVADGLRAVQARHGGPGGRALSLRGEHRRARHAGAWP